MGAITKPDSSTALQSGSTLLGLPRELRDIIYQYSLSYDEGLIIEVNCSTKKSHVPQMNIQGRHNQYLTQTPANFLKLVCKQTREETRGVILKTNGNIALFGMSYVTPSSYCFGLFVSRYPSKVISNHLRRITVHGYPDVEATTLMPVAFKEIAVYATGFRKFCEQYPQTLVILQFRNVVNVDSDHWYYWAGALQYIIRGSSPLIFPVSKPHFVAQLMQLEIAFATTPRLPDNLRFSILEVYPESGVESEVQFYDEMRILPADQIAELYNAARKLFDDGI
ncbi:hypothetical protein BKA66DRAFT_571648 [Pyrenochaeta sp. MPI-SDFR-AT-0127]|nr:hypothetical protein BKA66DRAFT_571648 [Pyrenochaeta sp. MPI-SDFR-AT-0127]